MKGYMVMELPCERNGGDKGEGGWYFEDILERSTLFFKGLNKLWKWVVNNSLW